MLDGYTGFRMLSAALPIIRNQPLLEEEEPEIDPRYDCEVQAIGWCPFTALWVVEAKTDRGFPVHVRQFAARRQLNEVRVLDEYFGRPALRELDPNAVVAAQGRR